MAASASARCSSARLATATPTRSRIICRTVKPCNDPTMATLRLIAAEDAPLIAERGPMVECRGVRADRLELATAATTSTRGARRSLARRGLFRAASRDPCPEAKHPGRDSRRARSCGLTSSSWTIRRIISATTVWRRYMRCCRSNRASHAVSQRVRGVGVRAGGVPSRSRSSKWRSVTGPRDWLSSPTPSRAEAGYAASAASAAVRKTPPVPWRRVAAFTPGSTRDAFARFLNESGCQPPRARDREGGAAADDR